MKLQLTDIENQQPIPGRFAFAVPDPNDHVTLSDNRNPAVNWSELPDGTRSLVLICVDKDVPTKPDDVNQEGREVPADLPRTDFFHWVMVDIPAECDGIGEGDCSAGVTAHGKDSPPGPEGSRQGINDYTGWFAGDTAMQGDYFGYDGPCPPWNDALVHHYHFILYATDLDRCPVDGNFTGQDVEQAIEGHVLASASVIGTYTLNPRLGA